MRVVVAAVGKPRSRALSAAIQEYEQRAARYWPLSITEVREESARATPVELVRERESERLLAAVDRGARIVVCEIEGQRMTSEQFAAWLHREREQATGDVAFLVGGAHGLSPAVRRCAWRCLSLAPWTLPHEMARLVLVEQLYRAGTIVRGEPYHK